MNALIPFLQQVTVAALPIIFAITLHEAAHGYMALAFGDDTAERAGRLSFNPLRHIDPFGTIILPAIMLFSGGGLFGWAKPVPVNFNRLRGGRLGMVAVAAAGPGANVLMALLAIVAWKYSQDVPAFFRPWVQVSAGKFFEINLILAVFNMIPIPPLDGGRVAVGLLPLPLASRLARLEPQGMLILMGLIFILPLLGTVLGINLDILGWILRVGQHLLSTVLFGLAG